MPQEYAVQVVALSAGSKAQAVQFSGHSKSDTDGGTVTSSTCHPPNVHSHN